MSLLHTKPEVAAQERMVDDGNGKVEVRLARALLQRRAACSAATPHFCTVKRLGVGWSPTTFRKVRDPSPQWPSPRRHI